MESTTEELNLALVLIRDASSPHGPVVVTCPRGESNSQARGFEPQRYASSRHMGLAPEAGIEPTEAALRTRLACQQTSRDCLRTSAYRAPEAGIEPAYAGFKVPLASQQTARDYAGCLTRLMQRLA